MVLARLGKNAGIGRNECLRIPGDLLCVTDRMQERTNEFTALHAKVSPILALSRFATDPVPRYFRPIVPLPFLWFDGNVPVGAVSIAGQETAPRYAN